MNKFLPCCVYPTTTILIDDDTHLTKWLTLKLQPYGPVIVFNDPKEALAYLEGYVPSTFVNRMNLEEFDLADFEKECTNEDHRNEIFCIIIDYAMPGLNGLQLAEALIDFPAKKIMLTGEADHALAVEAFNESAIDQFILKSTDNLMELLVATVIEMKWQRFTELSRVLTTVMDEPISNLKDNAFSAHIFGYLHDTMISEFYLENEYGDLLLVNESSERLHYLVREEKVVDDLVWLAQNLFDQDPDDDREVFDKITARTAIPFFPVGFDAEHSSLREWRPFFYDFVIVKGDRQNYYCAVK